MFLHLIWDLDDDPQGNVQHIAEHGITKAEVVEVLAQPETREESRSSGRPVAIGATSTGRTIGQISLWIRSPVTPPLWASTCRSI